MFVRRRLLNPDEDDRRNRRIEAQQQQKRQVEVQCSIYPPLLSFGHGWIDRHRRRSLQEEKKEDWKQRVGEKTGMKSLDRWSSVLNGHSIVCRLSGPTAGRSHGDGIPIHCRTWSDQMAGSSLPTTITTICLGHYVTTNTNHNIAKRQRPCHVVVQGRNRSRRPCHYVLIWACTFHARVSRRSTTKWSQSEVATARTRIDPRRAG
jgi:hypothetical protein